jgi:hypothetical protein
MIYECNVVRRGCTEKAVRREIVKVKLSFSFLLRIKTERPVYHKRTISYFKTNTTY